MASIKRRPDGQYRARYRDPAGKEHARHFALKKDAERWLESVSSDLHLGTYVDPRKGRETFGAWADAWLAESVHLKPKTVAGYQSMLSANVLPRWGTTPVAAIDRTACAKWVASMVESGKAPGTVRAAVLVARSVMRCAIESGAVKVNPFAGLRLPRPAREEMLFLTADEVNALAAAVDAPYSVLVLFAAYTGLRAGEIAALRVSRLDLLRGAVDVVESFADVRGKLILGPTKTCARRSVKLPRFLCEMLGAYLADRPHAPDDFVFTSQRGEPLRHANFYRRSFKPAVARAGLPLGLRFHDLRHTCCALLIAQGAHPKAIQERLGHSSITVTLDRYGHLLPTLDEALAAGLDTTYRASVANLADYTRTDRGPVPLRPSAVAL